MISSSNFYVNNIPIDLLKISPLQEYPIPYKILRYWYRTEGINWNYQPIHPELQDWENDPENPDRNKGGFFKNLFGNCKFNMYLPN